WVPRVAHRALATIRLRADEPVPVPEQLGALQPILERALQPDPASRPDASELVEALLVAARRLDRPTPLPLVGLHADVDDASASAYDDITVLPPRSNVDLTVHAPSTSVADAGISTRRTPWRWALAAFVVLVLAAGGFVLWSAIQPASAHVPVVAGKTVSDARAAIAAASTKDVHWKLRETKEYSDGVEPGVVIRTDPPQGRGLATGKTLVLIVSNGPTPVAVPDLYNYTEVEARSILDRAHLQVGTITPVFDDNVADGRVVTWGTTTAGARPGKLPKGTAVDIQVSKGPEPRLIPDLQGAPSADAQKELTKAGLAVNVQQEFSDTIASGKVTRTDPAAGQSAAKGATVTLYVSKGPDVVAVPNVVGMSLDQATTALEAAGFDVTAQGPPRGTVFETDPPVGTMAKRHSVVTVYLKR
ncbi:MAG: eukaryotic-like serine/threonine-protein kinase, partial [Actinomycetota bacterium]|nr:eukaryotic-like serine/threonine-protein kinase [Actinomycetota bacterium]